MVLIADVQGIIRSSRDSNLNLDTGLQADASDLLDDLAGGVEVNETLVDLELVAVPGFRTLTARSLTGGDLEDLGGQADGALDAELLVFSPVDQVRRELLQVLNVAARKGDADFVHLGSRDGASSIVVFFALSDVTHSDKIEKGE